MAAAAGTFADGKANNGPDRKRGTDNNEGARVAKRIHVEESAPAA